MQAGFHSASRLYPAVGSVSKRAGIVMPSWVRCPPHRRYFSRGRARTLRVPVLPHFALQGTCRQAPPLPDLCTHWRPEGGHVGTAPTRSVHSLASRGRARGHRPYQIYSMHSLATGGRARRHRPYQICALVGDRGAGTHSSSTHPAALRSAGQMQAGTAPTPLAWRASTPPKCTSRMCTLVDDAAPPWLIC